MNSTQEFTKSFLIEEGRFVVPGRGPGMGGGAKEARGGDSSVRYCISERRHFVEASAILPHVTIPWLPV